MYPPLNTCAYLANQAVGTLYDDYGSTCVAEALAAPAMGRDEALVLYWFALADICMGCCPPV